MDHSRIRHLVSAFAVSAALVGAGTAALAPPSMAAAAPGRHHHVDAMAIPSPPWRGWWSMPRPTATHHGEALPSDVLFAVNSATLRPEASSLLAAIAAQIVATTGPVEVDGYTDSTGTAAYNLALSKRRAQAVARRLEADGVPAARITVQGFGEADPVAPNTTPSNMALNRRVDVRFGG